MSPLPAARSSGEHRWPQVAPAASSRWFPLIPRVAFFVGTIGLKLPRPRELERHDGQIATYHPTCRSPNVPHSYGGCGEGAAPPHDQEPLSGVDIWGEVVDRLVLEGQLPEQALRVFQYGESVDQSPANAGTGAMVIPDWQDISVYENFPEIGQWAAMDIDPEELATRPRNSQVPAPFHVLIWFSQDWVWVDASFRSEVHWTWKDIKQIMHEGLSNLIPHPSTFCLINACHPSNSLHDEGHVDDPSTPRTLALVPLEG